MLTNLLHALDLGILGDWEGAKQCLEGADDPIASRLTTLMTQQQELESERSRAQAVTRHEIGNALSIAQANIEGMADGVLDVTPERLNGIRDALQTAGVLLNDLKKAQQPAQAFRELQLETFNICEVISSQVSMISGVAESKNVRVRYEPCRMAHGACTNYRGDATRTGQVLRNVLLNAVRYTPPGGFVEVLCYRPDGEIALTISDTGPGIDGEDLPRLFEHGYRGRSAEGTSGQGIGLAVVSKLLEVLGGAARVVDQTDRGATFVITLPA